MGEALAGKLPLVGRQGPGELVQLPAEGLKALHVRLVLLSVTAATLLEPTLEGPDVTLHLVESRIEKSDR